MKKKSTTQKLLYSTTVLGVLTLGINSGVLPLVGSFANAPVNQTEEVAETPEAQAETEEAVVETPEVQVETPETQVEAPTVENEVTPEVAVDNLTPTLKAAPKADVKAQHTSTVTVTNPFGETIGVFSDTVEEGELYNVVVPVIIGAWNVNMLNLPSNAMLLDDGTVLVTGTMGSSDVNTTLNYIGDEGSANIKIFDTDDNIQLDERYIDGYVGVEPTGFSIDEFIAEYTSQGYEVVSSNYPTNNLPITEIGETVDYIVNLKHGKDVTTETTESSRTILLLGENGREIQDSIIQEVSFSRERSEDKVNGHIGYGEWSNGSQVIVDAVDMPEIKGYEPSKKSVPSKPLSPYTGHIVEEVTYKAKTVGAKVEYFDADTNKVVKESKEAKGKYGTSTKVDTSSDLKDLKAKGYEVKEDNVSGKEVKLDVDGTKVERITLVHGKEIKGKTTDITRTINFKKEGKDFKKPIVQKVTYVSGVEVDKVTGEERHLNDEPQGSDSFDKVVVEQETGYTTDVTEIAEVKGVKKDDKSSEITVNYSAKDVKATVTYVDETNGEVLGTNEYEGKFDSKIKYDNKTQDELVAKGYLVSTDGTKGQTTFNVDGNKEMTVTMKHDVDVKTETQKKTRTINAETNGKNLDTTVQTVTFTKTTTTDKVTGEVIVGDWTQDKDGFEAFKTKSIKGYETDVKTIDAKSVTLDSEDEVVTVEYTKVKDDNGKGNGNGTDNGKGNGTDNGKVNGTDNGKGTDKGQTGNKDDKSTEKAKDKATAKGTDSKADDVQTNVNTHNLSGLWAMISVMIASVTGFTFLKRKDSKKEN